MSRSDEDIRKKIDEIEYARNLSIDFNMHTTARVQSRMIETLKWCLGEVDEL